MLGQATPVGYGGLPYQHFFPQPRPNPNFKPPQPPPATLAPLGQPTTGAGLATTPPKPKPLGLTWEQANSTGHYTSQPVQPMFQGYEQYVVMPGQQAGGNLTPFYQKLGWRDIYANGRWYRLPPGVPLPDGYQAPPQSAYVTR